MWSSDVYSAYYIQNRGAHLNALLLSANLPDEILRVYRSVVKCFTDWKASELRSFLLFYSPIALSHLLPKKYFKHWVLLVKSFQLLLQKTLLMKTQVKSNNYFYILFMIHDRCTE